MLKNELINVVKDGNGLIHHRFILNTNGKFVLRP